jgi:hypothetical protein
VSDEKQAYVRLELHDPTIIDLFVCYSEAGMEAEPAHRVLVHLKGNYAIGSDKLELNGQEIQLDKVQITGVSTKEDCLKSHATQNYVSIYMIDHVFVPFVELIRSNNIQTSEILLKLDARPLSERTLRLSVDGMDITRNAGVSIKEQHTLADTRQARLSAQLKTIHTLLFAIAVMTGLIVLHIFR